MIWNVPIRLSNKKDNPDYVDYVIRVASQGYVGTGDIVFEDIWMQFLDNNMKDTNILDLEQLDRDEAIKVFDEYMKDSNKVEY